MKIITGLSEQPKQQSTLVLADGTRAVWTLTFVPQQSGWFYDLTWNGTAIASGQRLVSSPNILRQYLNRISFGIAVISPNQLDPTTQTTFVDGSVLCYLLEGADLQTVETSLFNAPPGQVLPEVALPGGAVAPVLPSSWGPAGGDLAYLYPNPQVVAVHEGGGTRLPFAAVGDGQFLKRVGSSIIGAAVAPGTGDVVGPGTATVNNVVLFNNGTGTLIKDGGALGTAAFVNSSSFLAATASASGDLGGNFPSPTVTALHTGATQLTIGSIPDGQFLKRVGSSIVGSIPSGAGDVFGPASSTSGNVVLFDGTTGKIIKDSGVALGTIASQAANSVSISGGSLSNVAITNSTGAFSTLTASQLTSSATSAASFTLVSTGIGTATQYWQTNSTNRWSNYVPNGATNLVWTTSTTLDGSTGKVLDLSSTGLAVTGTLSATGTLLLRGASSAEINMDSTSVTAVAHTLGSYYNAGASYADLNVSAKDTIILSSGTERGRFSSSGLAVGGVGTFASSVGYLSVTSLVGTSQAYYQLNNTGGTYFLGIDNSTGTALDTSPYEMVHRLPSGRGLSTYITGTGVVTRSSASGLEVIGAAGVSSFTSSTPLGLRVIGATSTNDYSGIDFSTGGQPVRSRIGSYFSSAGSYLVFGTSNNYATGVTNSALTIDYDGVATFSRGLVITGSPASFVAGSLYFNATNGLTLAGKTGSANDLLLTNNAGSTVFRNPTGTVNAVFGGTVSATSFSGAVPVASLNGGTGASSTTFWRGDGVWATPAGGGGGISSISVASSNGFAGNSSGGTTPILTLSTTVTGLLKGNGTALSAATAGTDYVVPSGSVNNVTGIVAIANGGTGTNSPTLVGGTNVTITGTWPNQTINATGGGGGGGVTSVSGTGTVNGISLSGTVTTTGSLTLSGALSGDISATTSKSAATGAVLRSFTSRDGDVVNVKDFGASTANNAGQNTIAFGLAIDAAIAFPKGAIYVPTGTYKLNRLVISSAVPLTIYGDGEGSILQAYDTNGLIDFSSAANYATLEIRNLRMEALSASNAITATFLPVASYHIVNSFKLTSVTVAGGGSTWARAVKVSYAHNALISNCLFDGGSGTYSSGNRAFEVLATSVNMVFANTNFSFWGRGYSCEVYAEGASFTNCYFISNSICAYASVASSDLRITGLQFISCNFDARDTGSYVLYCNNVQGLLVSSCYILGGAGTSGGLRLIQTQFSSITGNKFFSTGQYGVTLENASPAVYDDLGNQIGCNAVSITGNNFVGDAFSVLVGTLTMNTVVQNNVRARAYSVGSPVTFQGAQMTVVNLNTSDASGGVTRGNYIQP